MGKTLSHNKCSFLPKMLHFNSLNTNQSYRAVSTRCALYIYTVKLTLSSAVICYVSAKIIVSFHSLKKKIVHRNFKIQILPFFFLIQDMNNFQQDYYTLRVSTKVGTDLPPKNGHSRCDTNLHLIVRLQLWFFGKFRVQFHCHYIQDYTNLELL